MGRLASAGILALAGLPQPARAAAPTLWTVNCAAGTISANGLPIDTGTASTVLGLVLGTPPAAATGTDAAQPGDTVEISGICTEDITIRANGLTLTNDNNSATPATLDGIEGQLEVLGAKAVAIDYLTLGFPASGATLAAGDSANVFIHQGAAATVANSTIANGPLIGLLVAGGSWAQLLNADVTGNGAAASAPASGLKASGGATVLLGAKDGTQGVVIAGNAGNGVEATAGSTADLYAAHIYGNGANQLLISQASNAYITAPSVICAGSFAAPTCTPGSVAYAAIAVTASSSVLIDGGAAVTGSVTNEALALIGSSSAVIQGSGFAAAGGNAAVLVANSASAIDLAGGNTICAGSLAGGLCTPAANGLAVQVEHVSNLLQVAAPLFGYVQAEDSISGGGLVKVNEQSNVDLGVGGTTLAWAPGDAGILVQQNSSFRLSGGATINGNLVFEQGSNGFFNAVNGGSNTVSSVSCLFGAVAASHISQGGSATLSPPASTSATPQPNQCLPF